MAKKTKKASSKSSASESNVVRIKASESAPKKSAKEAKTTKVAKEAVVTAKAPKKPRTNNAKGLLRPFAAVGNYFKGAWYELRQVRWPNRRATWSLTGAVLAYSAFFVILVLLLDAAFKYLFELILGK
ncbi:MAG: secE [Candidatus Saccharibacteria bacterium]|nr:secE [Candidatus Saccharibacteria bacterium]